MYASVNILPYFILHSDTANAWGVDRKGAALKDNFVKLFIEPAYDTHGLIVREKTRGYVRFAGEDVDRPARLFVAPPHTLGQANVFTPLLAVLCPNKQEQKILTLHATGKSHAEICKEVWGYKSDNRYPEIDAVLAKFGTVQRAN